MIYDVAQTPVGTELRHHDHLRNMLLSVGR